MFNRVLEFWPRAAVSAYLPNDGPTYYVNTKVLNTREFSEVIIQLVCETPIGAVDGRILVTPQIGNDLVNWEDQASFTVIQEDVSSYPIKETLKITTVAEYMRCKIALDLFDGGKPMLVVGTISITAVGRSQE